MQFPSFAFAIDETKPTITAIDGSIIEEKYDFSRVNISFLFNFLNFLNLNSANLNRLTSWI